MEAETETQIQDQGTSSGTSPGSRPLTRDEIRSIAARTYRDPVLFCTIFLDHWFEEELTWFHRGLLAILTGKCEFLLDYGELDKIARNFISKDQAGNEVPIFDFSGDEPTMRLGRYTMVMVPRGHGKTTITNASTLYSICFQNTDYSMYVSEAQMHSEAQTIAVRSELQENRKVLQVFGDLKPDQRSGRKWRDEFFETVTDVAIACRGRGGQVRGSLHKGSRPDRIIVDDVEDEESVLTEEQRHKTKVWFYGAVKPALPKFRSDATIIVLGTLLHQEALLKTLETDPDFTVVNLGVLDRDNTPLWPANMDDSGITREKQSYAQAGMLHVFYMEYFNEVRAPETAKFKPEHIYVNPKGLDAVPYRALAMDPAISENRQADFSGIAAVGIDENGIIQLFDIWLEKGANPRRQIDMFFKMRREWGTIREGVESNAYQAALIHLMREEMFRRRDYFEIEPLKHSSKKTERVEGILQPRYANGYVHHQKKFPEYETQLLDWPNGKMDGPDAVSMAVALLDDFAPNAHPDYRGAEQDNYPPLKEVFGGNWRSY